MSVFGDGRILPPPDHSSIVVNLSTGYRRENHSWVLGRLLRDFENEPYNKLFRVSVFDVENRVPCWDWVNYSGVALMMLQCLISIFPLILNGNWVVPLVTVVGTILGILDGALPQWRLEKWAARPNTHKTIALCRGNGSQHVMILVSTGKCCDLEDLASPRVQKAPETRLLLIILAVFRCLLLLVISCVTAACWYLFAIGAMGMVHNLIAAGASRSPSAHGFKLSPRETFEGSKVMKVLKDLEINYPRSGASLLKIFFPGPLRQDEEDFWRLRLISLKHVQPRQRRATV